MVIPGSSWYSKDVASWLIVMPHTREVHSTDLFEKSLALSPPPCLWRGLTPVATPKFPMLCPPALPNYLGLPASCCLLLGPQMASSAQPTSQLAKSGMLMNLGKKH